MTDNAGVFLGHAGKIAGHINEIDQGDIKGVTKSDKAGGFVRCIHVQTAGFYSRLIGDDPNGMAIHASKTDDNI